MSFNVGDRVLADFALGDDVSKWKQGTVTEKVIYGNAYWVKFDDDNDPLFARGLARYYSEMKLLDVISEGPEEYEEWFK